MFKFTHPFVATCYEGHSPLLQVVRALFTFIAFPTKRAVLIVATTTESLIHRTTRFRIQNPSTSHILMYGRILLEHAQPQMRIFPSSYLLTFFQQANSDAAFN